MGWAAAVVPTLLGEGTLYAPFPRCVCRRAGGVEVGVSAPCSPKWAMDSPLFSTCGNFRHPGCPFAGADNQLGYHGCPCVEASNQLGYTSLVEHSLGAGVRVVVAFFALFFTPTQILGGGGISKIRHLAGWGVSK